MQRYEPIKKKHAGVFDQILTAGHKLPGGNIQRIHEQSTVQNYDIGTRLVMDDRVFRYCKAGSALRDLLSGNCAMSQIEVYTHATASVVGSYYVTILDTAARVKDWYAGGYIWIMRYAPTTTGIGQLHRIKASEASAGVSVKLTLEEPLEVECGASTWITAWASIYSNIKIDILPKSSLVCIPLIEVASGSYFWGQTWGPIFLQCGYSPGSKNYDREVYWKSDHYGFLPGSEIDFTSDVIPQRIGFLLPDTAVIGTDNFVMLQISP